VRRDTKAATTLRVKDGLKELINAGAIDLPPEVQRREAPDRLLLPHPRLQDRGFVLLPLAEISPVWRHPILCLTVREMTDALPVEARLAVNPL
jgi:2-amino-4-hydroxy-6-hydroxymethyldihydropteridine diphosphokinase